MSRHREVMGLPSKAPAISDNCFIAPSANIVGNVKVLPHPLANCRLLLAQLPPVQGVVGLGVTRQHAQEQD